MGKIMAEIDVYEQYFAAEAEYNGVKRHGAKVLLTSVSGEGNIRYDMSVIFFPHNDEEDYAVSYDAVFTETVYEGKGRRSRKREEKLLEGLRGKIDEISFENGGRVDWERPLREARRG